MNEGPLQSPLVNDVFSPSLILITLICSSFVFMFVREGRWIFSTAAVRDVKTVDSIRSLYLYFLLWHETEKKRHWKSFVVGEDRSSIYYSDEGVYYKASLREHIEGDYWELSSYPLVSWHRPSPFDSLVCWRLYQKMTLHGKRGIKNTNICIVQGCMCVPLCMQACVCVCLSLPKVWVSVYSVCISARNQVVCGRNLVVCTCVLTFAHMCSYWSHRLKE